MTHAGPPPLRELVGAVLHGRYRIERLVGTGGMGAVFEATQLSLGRRVAVKVIKPRADDNESARADALRRFERETQAIARLQHPNIVGVVDAGRTDDGITYLAMELLHGEDLRRVMRREGAIALPRALAIVEDVASALAAAHAAGVVHRDLKAENVMLVDVPGKREVAKVLDFGIARLVVPAPTGADGKDESHGGERITATGVVAGTPGCMAPEHMLGKGDDARSDLYSLGVLLFELVAGAAPFTASSNVELMMKHLTEPAPRLSSKASGVDDRGVDDLAAALLAKDPAARPQSAVVVVERLRAANHAGHASRAPQGDVTATDLQRPNLQVPAVTPIAPAVSAAQKPIAVLPIKMVGPAEDAYLADGATEDLIDALSMTKGLRVRSRGVVAQQLARVRADGDVDACEIGRALDVDCVVEGSLRRTPTGVMLTARLVSVADGNQIWAKRFQCALGELLVATDDAARAVADTLHAQVQAPKRAAVSDDVAVELYLQARASLRRNWYSNGTDALVLFQRALERASDDPLILAGYATARARYARTTDEMHSARALAEKATVAAPHRAEPWLALAMVLRQDVDDEQQVPLLARAMRIAPDHPDAHYQLGRLILGCGPLAPALKHLERAVALEPSDAERRAYLGLAQIIGGDIASAEATFAGNVDGLPGASIFRSNAGRFAMATHRPFPFAPENPTDELLAEILRGERPARASIEARVPRIPRRAHVGFLLEAEVYSFLGDAAAALAALQRAIEAGTRDELWILHAPSLAAMRADSAFEALRAQLHGRNDALRAALATHGLT